MSGCPFERNIIVKKFQGEAFAGPHSGYILLMFNMRVDAIHPAHLSGHYLYCGRAADKQSSVYVKARRTSSLAFFILLKPRLKPLGIHSVPLYPYPVRQALSTLHSRDCGMTR